VRILFSLDGRGGDGDGKDFQQGDVLVTDMTDPDWEPIMKKASAIITNKGGRTCHAAIVAREMGVPAIVGCGNATDLLDTGMEVTASCCEGDVRHHLPRPHSFHKEETMLSDIPTTKTPIMLNVASPDLAFKFAGLPNAGVGLAREEFIINNYIQAHPLALLQHKELGDVALSGKISYLINGYRGRRDLLREAPQLRHRQDRRGLLPQQGDRALQRFQEQRVQEPAWAANTSSRKRRTR
jgi:pyruvate,water dikinase